VQRVFNLSDSNQASYCLSLPPCIVTYCRNEDFSTWRVWKLIKPACSFAQVCLAVVLAQVGADVPAEAFSLSPVDRVFVRMGARDHIMSGQSTFFVELSETAAMLRSATRYDRVQVPSGRCKHLSPLLSIGCSLQKLFNVVGKTQIHIVQTN
jgi:hypothetical protein